MPSLPPTWTLPAALWCALACSCAHDVSVIKVDKDEDGATNDTDCNDSRADVFPGARELCDGIDNDCDGEVDEELSVTLYPDSDFDGYGDRARPLTSCDPDPAWLEDGTDCNDDRADIHPGAEEVCDDIDNNCDGEVDEGLLLTFFTDGDGDGWGADDAVVQVCEDPGSGYLAEGGDCDDADALVYPGAVEACDDGVDQDCDGEDAICRVRGDLAIDTDVNLALVGETTGGLAGFTLDLAADVDGDGVSELLVGAPMSDCGRPGGCMYLVEMDPSTVGLVELAQPVGASWRVLSARAPETGARYGEAVAEVGDLDGDGRPEIAASSVRAHAYGIRGGLVDVYNAALITGTSLVAVDMGVRIRPSDRYMEVGWTVAAGGDLNGDGYGELIVSATSSTTESGARPGEIYVYNGCPEGLGQCYDTDLDGDIDARVAWGGGQLHYAGGADAKLSGRDWDYLGAAVASRFDFNADGQPDLAIGAPGAATTPEAGAVYLTLTYPFVTDVADNAAEVAWHGEAETDRVGGVVVALGDLDQDGYDDLGFGAPEHDGERGAVYVVLGRSDAALSTYGRDVTLDQAEVVQRGDAAGDRFGASLARAGDVNLDTFADLLVGAPGASPEGVSGAGQVHVLLGPPADGALFDEQATLYGVEADGQVGAAVAGGLDVNGDGADDIALGAPGFRDTGRVFMLFGGSLL